MNRKYSVQKSILSLLIFSALLLPRSVQAEADKEIKIPEKSKAVFQLAGGKHECKFFYGYFQEFEPFLVYIIMAPRKLTEKELKSILAYEEPETLKDSYWALVEIKFHPQDGKAEVSTISTDFHLKERSTSVNKIVRKQNDKSFSLVGIMAIGETISFGLKDMIREEDREQLKGLEDRILQFDFQVQCKLQQHPVKSLWDKRRGIK